MSLKDALKTLRRSVPRAFDYRESREAISTGCIVVDTVTGIGGFPRGRLSEVFGWEGSGKTVLCLTACARAQEAGLYPVYIDIERGVDLTMADKIGFIHDDPAKGLYLTPDTHEETIKIIHELTNSEGVHLIVADSVPAMVPKDEMEGKIEDLGAIALRSRLIGAFLNRITKDLEKTNTALVMVNQMRQNIATGYGAKYEPKEKSSGGSTIKFLSSLRLNLRLSKKGSTTRKLPDPFTGEETEVAVANRHSVEVFKNKVGIAYRTGAFYIRYDETKDIWGIDNLQTVLEMAVAQDIVKKRGGGYFAFTGKGETEAFNFSIQGESVLYDYLRDHPEVAEEIRGRVQL
jgi:recombination protein RecA